MTEPQEPRRRGGPAPGTVGAEIAAAKRIGCTVEEYRRRRAAGDLWCWNCHGWHPQSAFGRDRARHDGKARRCKESDAAKKRAMARDARRARGLPEPAPPPRPAQDHTDLLHEIYDLAAARRPHDEIMDTIREAVGRP